MSKNLQLNTEKIYERIVFVTRLSAIGDVIIAMRSILLLKRNGYFPILVTSSNIKDVPLKFVENIPIICVNDTKKLTFYIEKKEVDKDYFHSYIKHIKTKNKKILLDLQKTARSARAYKIVKNECHFKINKIYGVKKRTFFRLFLVLRSWIKGNQFPRTTQHKIIRIHILQEHIIHKIIMIDKPNYVSLPINLPLFNKDSLKSEFKNSNYICIFPGASGIIKMWPKEHFKKLVALLLSETKLHIYICGNNDLEYILAESINDTNNDRVKNLVNKMSLNDTLNLVSHSKYVVTNDSFAAHAADAFLVPATVIFGSTSPNFGFVPLYEKINVEYLNLQCSPCSRHGKGTCHFQNLKCLADIKPEKILTNILCHIENI